jgi:hypothetical protein
MGTRSCYQDENRHHSHKGHYSHKSHKSHYNQNSHHRHGSHNYQSSFQTTKDYIDYAKNLHSQLAHRLHLINSHTDNTRTHLLLDYLCQHEQYMLHALERVENSMTENVLNAWFQFTPAILETHFVEELALDEDDVDLHHLLMQALKLDDYLIELYQELADQSDIPEVEASLLDLKNMELHEKIKTVRSGLSINDF